MSIVSARSLIKVISTWEQVMKHRDGIFASFVLALSVTLMAGLVGTGTYASAAAGEAVGYHALSYVVASKAMQQGVQQ
jgi:hypothetical protein